MTGRSRSDAPATAPARRCRRGARRGGGARRRRAPAPQHAVHLPEDAVEVVDEAEGPGREHQVDAVRPQEGEVGEVTVVQLDLDALALAEAASERQLLARRIDADGVRPAWRTRSSTAPHRSRARARACPEGGRAGGARPRSRCRARSGRRRSGDGPQPGTRPSACPMRRRCRRARLCRHGVSRHGVSRHGVSRHGVSRHEGILPRQDGRVPGSACGELLDHPVSVVVVVLHRRALHEVGGGAEQRPTDAAILGDLGAADRVDDHARGVG